MQRRERDPTIAYALAHASKTLFWTASDLYFAFYLTEVCGIPALAMGLVLAGSYLVNAASDWGLGRALAATVRTARGAARLQLLGAVLCSGTLFFFALAARVPPDARLAACLAALLTFRLSYALYDIPQNSLLALAARDERRRARLAAARLFVSGIVRIALTAAFVPLFVRRTSEAQIEAFLVLVALMAVLGVASAAVLASRFPRTAAAAPAAQAERVRAPMELHLMMLILSFGTTVFTQLESYLAAFTIASRWQGAVLLTAVAVGTSLSQPVWMTLATRLPPPRVTLAAMLTAMGGAVLFPFLALRGALAAAAVGGLYGAGVGGLFFLLWTGIARHAAHTHGTRGATATLGSFAGSAKLGQASAMLGVGFCLQSLEGGGAALPGAGLTAVMSGAVLLALLGMLVLAGRTHTLAEGAKNNIAAIS